MVQLGALNERFRTVGGELDGSAAGFAGGDRIGAFEDELPATAGLLARFGQPDCVRRPQAMITFAAAAVAIDPPAGLALLAVPVLLGFDAQIEAAAVVVPATFARITCSSVRRPISLAMTFVHIFVHTRA